MGKAANWILIHGCIRHLTTLLLVTTITYQPLLLAQTDLRNPETIPTGPNLISMAGPLTGDARGLEDALFNDIKQWDPRVLAAEGEFHLDYNSDKLKQYLLTFQPQLDPTEQNWVKNRERIGQIASEVAERMLLELDLSSRELGVTCLLETLMAKLKQENSPSLGTWQRVADYLNGKSKSQWKGRSKLDGNNLLDFNTLYRKHGPEKLRLMILEIAENPTKTFPGDMGALDTIIRDAGAKEVARDLSTDKIRETQVPQLGKAEFILIDNVPAVKFSLKQYGRSLAVIRKTLFMERMSRHLKQWIGRQFYDSGPVDQWGRKQGRDTAVGFQQDGKLLTLTDYENPRPAKEKTAVVVAQKGKFWCMLESLKPENWAERMHYYWYATVKGMSVSRTAFGLASGVLQMGMTYWLATFADKPIQFEAALVALFFGSMMGANFGTYQNWRQRGSLRPVAYHDESWRNETNPFVKFAKQIKSVALLPTLTSRYARSMSITVSFANLLMLATHSGEIDFTTLAGTGAAISLYFHEVVWRIAANTWVSNKGRSALEEAHRLYRDQRVLTENYVIKVGEHEVETDLAKLTVAHQMTYNLTNNMFKLMDYITPWGWLVFTTGNFLNLILEALGLRFVAASARRMDPSHALETYRLYETSVLIIIKNFLTRMLTGQSDFDRHRSLLTEQERQVADNQMAEAKERYENNVAAAMMDFRRRNRRLSGEDLDISREVLEDALNAIKNKLENDKKEVDAQVYVIYHQRKEEKMDQRLKAIGEKIASAKAYAKGLVGSTLKPFAPQRIKDQLPTLSKVRTCRTSFL